MFMHASCFLLLFIMPGMLLPNCGTIAAEVDWCLPYKGEFVHRKQQKRAMWFLLVITHMCLLQAANAGGVAVSGLEMSQNAMRLQWTSEEVDNKLKVKQYICGVFVPTLAWVYPYQVSFQVYTLLCT